MPNDTDAAATGPSAADASTTDALRRLASACESVGAPFPPLSDERFDAAHWAFERSSTQQDEIRRLLARLVQQTRPADERLRVLSVGPGNGMLDLPLIGSLASAGVAMDYVGVDPNPVAGQRFAAGFREIESGGVSLSVRECGIDDLDNTAGYDLIHAVHSLYYVADPPRTLSRLIERLTPGGRLVVFQAPWGALNRLAACFWTGADGRTVWFSEQLEAWLREGRRRFEKHTIDARLDVTGALATGDADGRLVFDFALHTAAETLPSEVRQRALECLRAISAGEGGRSLAPHPVDAFVVYPD